MRKLENEIAELITKTAEITALIAQTRQTITALKEKKPDAQQMISLLTLQLTKHQEHLKTMQTMLDNAKQQQQELIAEASVHSDLPAGPKTPALVFSH